MPTIELIFCHGWGYTSQIFEQLAQKLAKNFLVQNIDLGFFNHPTPININSNHYNIWISHSYGLMFGKLNYDNYIHKYIAINPILSFNKFEKSIQAMLYSLQKDRVFSTLTKFYQLCDDKNPPEFINFNKNTLISALKDMLNFDKNLCNNTKYMHFLHGKQDIFYEDNLYSNTHISHKAILGGHLLPIYNSSQVEHFIRIILFDTVAKLLQN